MGNLKTKAVEALHKTRQYILSTILTPVLFAIVGFLISKFHGGKTTAMSELLSWIEWVLIPALLGLVAVFLWHFFRIGLRLKAILRFFRLSWKVITHLKTSGQLLTIVVEQQKNPSEWLLPVINIIDLNVQGFAVNDVIVRFQIDSLLLFEVKEFYVFARLCLTPNTIQSGKSEWYEIKKPNDYAPIGQLVRYDFFDTIHLQGETDGEKVLLGWMQDFRSKKPLLAMLEIGIKFKKDDKPIPEDLNILKGNLPRYISPMNDYRMA